MKIYTIIGGVNGTGKSSLTGVLKAQRNDLGVIVDVDKITALAGVGALEGGKLAVKRIEECLDKGISFTQETTLSGFRTAQTAARVKEGGYYVRMFYVGLDTPQESLERIQTVSGVVVTISEPMMCCGVSPDAGKLFPKCCRIVMKSTSLTMTTVL